MEIIRRLDEECKNLYEESTQVWNQLLENAELQALEQSLQTVQEKKKKIKYTMSTLPPTKKMEEIVQNRKMCQEINQIRVEQQILAKNIDPL
jgi:hypothetical protein